MAPASLDVRQLVPVLFPRDGVGNHVLATQRALRRAGLRCHTWAEHFDPRLRLRVHRYRARRRSPRRRTVMLYQASTGSEGMVDSLLREPEPLAIYYHNITPPEFFERYDGSAAASMRRGREELRWLAGRARLAFAASEYSAAELRQLGVQDVRVLPPFCPASVGDTDRSYLQRLRLGKRGVDVLFVGRLHPHKGQLALIRVAAVLRAGLGQPVRLFLVGGEGPPTYVRALRFQVERLGVQRSVVFTGALSQGRLAAHYQAADVFICLSEHEGFGIPILEAMRVGLPVVALAAGAVAETLGGTGTLLRSADPLVTAEVVARMVTDSGLRDEVVHRQRQRAATLDSIDRDGPLVRGMRVLVDE